MNTAFVRYDWHSSKNMFLSPYEHMTCESVNLKISSTYFDERTPSKEMSFPNEISTRFEMPLLVKTPTFISLKFWK
ncbi:MAG: hypothetical protein J6V70_05750, partial [Kiritimatiellae bacterium]|nr:hypothetical protein [Kiritimatiellia bacterium]